MTYSRLWDANGLTPSGNLVLSEWETAGAHPLTPARINVASQSLTDRLGVSGSLTGVSRDQTVLSLPQPLHTRYGQGSNGGTYGYMWGDGWLILNGLSDLVLQDFTLAAPNTRYEGHDKERGFNGILVNNCTHILLRRLRFINMDTPIFLKGNSTHITVSDIELENAGRSSWGEWKGHYGVSHGAAHDCLIEDVKLGASVFYHTVSVQGSRRNVIRRIHGTKLILDHHRDKEGDLSDHNLWTDIDVGTGTAFAVAGSSTNPLSIGERETYWGVRKGGSLLTSVPTWPKIVVVGADTDSLNTSGRWTERIPYADLTPKDLYQAQVGASLPPPPPPPPDPRVTAKIKLMTLGLDFAEADVCINPP